MFHRLPLIAALLAMAVLAHGAEVVVSAGDELARQPAAERSAAVKLRWSATPVALPEGRLALTAALAALAANGNAVSLGDGIDGARAAELSGFNGDWWGAVLVVCEAYGLEPLPGQEAGGEAPWSRHGDDEGQPLATSAGPVVLVARTAGSGPRMACGPLLLEVTELSLTSREGEAGGWADIGLRARIEPRFPVRDIGRLSVRWDQALAGDVATDLQSRDVDGQGPRLRLSGLPAGASRLSLGGAITINALAPLRISTSLQPGDTARIDLGEHQLTLKLFNAEQARAAGKRTPCAILAYPAAALSSTAELAVLVEGKPIPSHGSGTRQGRDGECEQTRFFAGLADVAHQVVIEAAQPLGSLELPLALDLDLAALPATAIDAGAGDAADVASSLALAGGEIGLSDAVRLLRSSGSEVLVDLGVDARARAVIPAARLGFWDATLAVAQAFHLDLMPPQASDNAGPERGRNFIGRAQSDGGRGDPVQVCGGPLGIGRLRDDERPLGRAACGPVLAEVMKVERTERRTLAGTARLANLQLRLRLEPRIARELVSESLVVWSSAASDEAGIRLVVGHVERDGVDDGAPRGDASLATVQVSGLTSTTQRFTIAGQLLLRLQRPVRGEAQLELGGAAAAVRLGALPLTVSLVDGQNGEQSGVQLVYANDRLGNDLQVVVRGADGIEMAQRGRSSRGSGRRQTDTWHVAGLQPGARYSVSISTSETLATPVIALSVPVELP